VSWPDQLVSSFCVRKWVTTVALPHHRHHSPHLGGVSTQGYHDFGWNKAGGSWRNLETINGMLRSANTTNDIKILAKMGRIHFTLKPKWGDWHGRSDLLHELHFFWQVKVLFLGKDFSTQHYHSQQLHCNSLKIEKVFNNLRKDPRRSQPWSHFSPEVFQTVLDMPVTCSC